MQTYKKKPGVFGPQFFTGGKVKAIEPGATDGYFTVAYEGGGSEQVSAVATSRMQLINGDYYVTEDDGRKFKIPQEFFERDYSPCGGAK